jgi:hypothetical protein
MSTKGAAFPEFDRTAHVSEHFEILQFGLGFRACDYGYGQLPGVLWFTVAPDETAYSLLGKCMYLKLLLQT